MNLNLLNVFLAVYQHQSFTKAAESLEMTQPGVSRCISQLSEQLGMELFIREGRGITATRVAHEFANRVQPALLDIESSLKGIKAFDENGEYNFIILVSETVHLLLLPLVIRDPELSAKITLWPAPNNDSEVLEQLNMQKIDLAIDLLPDQPLGQSFSSQSFYEDYVVLLVNKDHPRIKNTISIEEYYAEEHTILELPNSRRHAINTITTIKLEERRILTKCNSVSAAMLIASNSEAISYTLKSIANRYAEQFNLKSLDLPFDTKPLRYDLIWHKRNEDSPANQWLRKKILALSRKL
ncbi:MAG: LysR family transcriptional regulator [Psychromonas sp.]